MNLMVKMRRTPWQIWKAERHRSGETECVRFILTLRLSYEHGMVKVFSEYNIRKVLGLGAANIAYQDGSESAEVTILQVRLPVL